MTAPSYADVRKAIYARLDAELTCDVWSPQAPQESDAQSSGAFPFVVIVQANEGPWNTKDSTGLNALVQIDAYARTTETDSAENIVLNLVASTRGALERYQLTIQNGKWIDTEFESSATGWEDGGKTRRAIMLFRVTVDEA